MNHNNDLQNDELIAQLLQEEFDAEEKHTNNEQRQESSPTSPNLSIPQPISTLKKSISMTLQDIFQQKKPNSEMEAPSPLAMLFNRKNSRPEPESPVSLNMNQFLKLLNSPESANIAGHVKNFIKEFSKRNLLPDEQSRVFNQFMELISDKLREHPVWNSKGEAYLIEAEDCVEMLVTNQLYSRMFCPSRSDDSLQDIYIYKKIFIHRWVELQHLEVSHINENSDSLTLASKELVKMNEAFTPCEKLKHVMNCARHIYDYIGEKGADDYIPVLVYVCLQANPPKLISNIRFISRFHRKSQMTGESFYYFTNLTAAYSFIEKLNQSNLKVEDNFYKSKVALGEKIYYEILKKEPAKEDSPSPKATSSSSKRSENSTPFSPALAFNNFKSNVVDKSIQIFGKMFKDSPTPESKSPNISEDHPGTVSQLVNESNDKNKNLLYDYDLQMALALSLSMENERQSPKNHQDENT